MGERSWFNVWTVGLVLMLVAGYVFVTRFAIQARGCHTPERDAHRALMDLSLAQSMFRDGDKENDGVLDYGTLAELSRAGLITTELGSGNKRGYVYRCEPSPTTPEFLWHAMARPTRKLEEARGVPQRTFFVNQTGVVFWRYGPILVDWDTCNVSSLTAVRELGR